MKHKAIQKTILFVLMLRLFIQPIAAAETETGGIHILKTNASGEPLSGARFYVAREATDLEKKDSGCKTETMTIGEEQMEMVYESFFSDKKDRQRPVWETETDMFGTAAMYGLPVGTYYLVEAKAPEGYKRITSPIRISVNKYSHLTAEDGVRDDKGVIVDNTIHIINLRYRVPETGHPEKILFVLAGIGVTASAAALWLIGKNRG